MRAVYNLTARRIWMRAAHAAAHDPCCSTAGGWRTWSPRSTRLAFTRADLVELVGALLPVDAPGHPRVLIEQITDWSGCGSARPATPITAKDMKSSPWMR